MNSLERNGWWEANPTGEVKQGAVRVNVSLTESSRQSDERGTSRTISSLLLPNDYYGSWETGFEAFPLTESALRWFLWIPAPVGVMYQIRENVGRC